MINILEQCSSDCCSAHC